MADVEHDDERRRLVALGQRAHIILGLGARVVHQHVPGLRPAAAAAMIGLAREEIRLTRDLVLGALQPRLLGLEDETIALVKIDPFRPHRTVAVALLDDALEHVIVGLGIARRVGRRHAEREAQLGQEHRIIRPLLPALAPLPFREKRVDGGRGRGRIRVHGGRVVRSRAGLQCAGGECPVRVSQSAWLHACVVIASPRRNNPRAA